jgi:hypothetical protein
MMNAEGQKSTQMRVAFALMCGLAICCAAMYITADGNDVADETVKYTDIMPYIQQSKMAKADNSKYGHGTVVGPNPTMKDFNKVESYDTKKAGVIITQTTSKGREVLAHYFKRLEAKIAAEVAARKYDINQLKTKMAKNMALNAAARKKMKVAISKQMATNAKIAKDALDKKMGEVAVQFAKTAEFENKRYKHNEERSSKTREVMRKNKAHNAKELRIAVTAQQRAMTALAAATAAKISKTDKRIEANSDQIKKNARKARKDLDHAMHKFDKNMLLMTAEAKAGRTALARQASTMDKKVRAMIDGKIKMQVERAKVQFQSIEAQMAEDRRHAAQSLAAASTRLTGALAAQAAVNNKNFAKTVSDIAKAKAESNARIKKASQEFKAQILGLSSTAHQQIQKLNMRESVLTGKVNANKAAQQQVNGKVRGEIDHMVKIGNERESKLAKKNKQLGKIIAKNKAAAEKMMQQIANNFYTNLEKIKKQMAKDRAFAEHRLGKACQGLYSNIASNIKAQAAVNQKLDQATRRAAMDAAVALRQAKSGFASHIGKLSAVVAKNEKKSNAAVAHLTGVVHHNDLKDAAARQVLVIQQKANKATVKDAIGQAIAKGEARAQQIEKMAKKMNKKTRVALNARISTEISHLTKKIHHGIEDLQLSTRGARRVMKRQVRESLLSEAAVLKMQVKDTVKWANKRFVELGVLSSKNKKVDVAAAKARASKAIVYAVLAQARCLVSLKEELSKGPKKGNANIAAFGELMVKNADTVVAQMKANLQALVDKVEEAKDATSLKIGATDKLAALIHIQALDAVKAALSKAASAVEDKFGKVYAGLGKARAANSQRLASAVVALNNALAKNAALQSASFSKTVTNIVKAKKQAAAQVDLSRKGFTLALASVTASITAAEQRKVSEIQIVGKFKIPNSVQKARVGDRTRAEIDHVITLANKHFSDTKRKRGAVKELMDKTKLVAAQQVKDLKKSTLMKLESLSGSLAPFFVQSRADLVKATEMLFEKHADAQIKETASMSKVAKGLAKVSAVSGLASAEAEFKGQYNTYVNTWAALQKWYGMKMHHITGVGLSWSKDPKTNGLVSELAKTMVTLSNKCLVHAIQEGEIEAKIVLDRETAHMLDARKALLAEVGELVEAVADKSMRTIHAARKNMANNYLSLKGYCGAADNKIINFVQSSKGYRNLMSIGDFLQTVAIASKSKTDVAYGIGAGLGSIAPAFGGSPIKESAAKTKTDGLVNEYTLLFTQVRMRWGMGLGKYLLAKLNESMAGKGVLTVGKKFDAEGQFVYVSGNKLGLSNKLSDLQSIAAPLVAYQAYLSKLTSKLPANVQQVKFFVPPPEWDGN